MSGLKDGHSQTQQMQAALRAWVAKVAAGSVRGFRDSRPEVLLGLLCAAAVSPLLVAAAGMGAVLVAGSGVVSGLGGGVLSGLLTEVAQRAVGKKEKADGESAIAEKEIAAEIGRVLAAGDANARELRTEIAGLLHDIDAGGTLLRAAMEEGNERVRSEVIAAIGVLSTDFAEMGFLIRDVARAAADIRQTLDAQGTDVRVIIEQNNSQSTEIRLVMEQLAVLVRRAGERVPGAGPADGDRAASRWLRGCPYRGLLPFEEGDAEVFYGRERLTAQLTARIAGLRSRGGMVIVTGASGAGKSSLLRAGLLPALARGQQVDGSQSWPRITITPTASPLTEFAGHLAALGGGDAAAIRDGLRRYPVDAHLAVWQAVLASASRPQARPLRAAPRLILIVDQFEQVFTLNRGADGEADRQAFITALCAASGTPVGSEHIPPALVVIAVRGDFWDRCATYPEFAGTLQEAQFVVGPMTESELRLAITGPADAAGLRIEPALTDTILGDLRSAGTENAAGVLPLLSQAMALTWDSREGAELNELTSHGYGLAGGISRAVETSADRVFDALHEGWQGLARELLCGMTVASSDGRFTRRPVRRSDQYSAHSEAEPGQVDAVLEAFAAERLVVLNGAMAELSHDALLTAWPKLRGWLDEDRASWVLHGQLAADAEAWREHSDDPSFLYRGGQLAAVRDAADRWAANPGRHPAVSGVQGDFLSASQRAATRSARQRRRAFAALAALTALTILATITLTYVTRQEVQQRQDAIQQRDQVIYNEMSAEAGQISTSDPSLAAQLALADYQMDRTGDDESYLIGAENAPLSTPLTPLTGIRVPYYYSVAFSPDGRTLAAANDAGDVQLWDVADPALPRPLGRPVAVGPSGTAVRSVAFSPDDGILATTAADGVVRLWDVTDPARPRPLPHPLPAGGQPIAVSFSPDGQTLATATQGGPDRLWDVTNPGSPRLLGQLPLAADATDYVYTLAFSPDGRTLATGSTDGSLRLWDVTRPASPVQRAEPIAGHSNVSVFSVAFSSTGPGGATLAAGLRGGTIRLWTVPDAAQATPLGQPIVGAKEGNNVLSVSFSPDGDTLVTGSSDGTARLWNVTYPAAPEPIGEPFISSSTPTVASAVLSREGELAIAGNGVRLGILPHTVLPSTGQVGTVAYSPDHLLLATGTADGRVQLWNVTDPVDPLPFGAAIEAAPGHAVFTVAFSPDSATLAVGTADGKIRLWNVTDPARPMLIGSPITAANQGFSVDSLTFGRDSTDGVTLAAGSRDGYIRLWNVTNPRQPELLTQPPLPAAQPGNSVLSVAFSPNGRTLAAGSSDGYVRLWDMAGPGAAPRSAGLFRAADVGTTVATVAFSPVNDDVLATGGSDGVVRLWDVADPIKPALLDLPYTSNAIGNLVYSVAFNPVGDILAAGTDQGTIQLWNVTNPDRGQFIGTPFAAASANTPVFAVRFSPVDNILASGGGDTTTRIWDLNLQYAEDQVCAKAANNLTASNWRGSVPQLPYRETCPAQAAEPAAAVQVQVPGKLTSAALSGTWTGTYFCGNNNGLTGLTLTIAAQPNGTLIGVFSDYAIPSNPHLPSAEYTLTGTYSDAGMAFGQGDWVRRPPGYVMSNLTAGPPAAGGTTLTGNIASPLCTTFTVTKTP